MLRHRRGLTEAVSEPLHSCSNQNFICRMFINFIYCFFISQIWRSLFNKIWCQCSLNTLPAEEVSLPPDTTSASAATVLQSRCLSRPKSTNLRSLSKHKTESIITHKSLTTSPCAAIPAKSITACRSLPTTSIRFWKSNASYHPPAHTSSTTSLAAIVVSTGILVSLFGCWLFSLSLSYFHSLYLSHTQSLSHTHTVSNFHTLLVSSDTLFLSVLTHTHARTHFLPLIRALSIIVSCRSLSHSFPLIGLLVSSPA